MKARHAELKRAYKLAPPAMGVYAVRNTATGVLLLDASRNVEAALNRHRAELRLGGHRNPALKQDWRRHGEAAFVFEVVAVLEVPADPAFDAERELAALLAREAARLGCARTGVYA
jgi:hypothetical protein